MRVAAPKQGKRSTPGREPQLANLETRRIVRGHAAAADRPAVALRHELGCDADANNEAKETLADGVTCAGQQAPCAIAVMTEQAPGRALRSLLGWTNLSSLGWIRYAAARDFPD